MTSGTALWERARAYDLGALAELYDRYAPRMYAYIYRRVSDAALAEDLTAELFARVLAAIQNERTWRASPVAWLYRIAHNLVIDHYRRQPAQPPTALDAGLVAAEDDDPQDAIEVASGQEQLRKALHCLTPDQQQVLALRYGEGLTARETGQVLRKTTGAVEALQRRALAALRRLLEQGGSA